MTNPASIIPKPATVIAAPKGKLNGDFIKRALTQIDDIRRFKDDVFQDAFLETIIVQICREYDSHVPEQVPQAQYGRKLKFSLVQKADMLLAPGPYFFMGSSIHQAWRLYEDHLEAFVISVIPETTEQTER